MKWSLLQKIPLKSSRKKHSKHANFQISINKNNINTIFHLPRLFEKSVSAWCFFYGRSLRRMSMERRSAGQKRNGNVWKKRRRFLIRVSPDDLNSLGWELVVERFPNQWWWLVVAGVDDSRSSCWVFVGWHEMPSNLQKAQVFSTFLQPKGIKQRPQKFSQLPMAWCPCRACKPWDVWNLGSKHWGTFTKATPRRFSAMRAMRNSPRIPIIPSIGMVKMFSYLDVIHRYTYQKKITEISGNKKSGTCVLKVHKNLWDLCFFGGRLARVNENNYVVFFWGGRIWFVVGRKCSLKLAASF